MKAHIRASLAWFGLSLGVVAAACTSAGDVSLIELRGPSEDVASGQQQAAPNTTATTMTPALRAAYIQAVQANASDAYRVERSGPDELRAESPAQGLVARFAADGISFERAQGAPFQGSLSLRGYGCEGELETGGLSPVSFAEPTYESNRVEYQREELIEWYMNGPLGLEQGFTLPAPPSCRGEKSGVVLGLELGGELSASMDSSSEIVLKSSEGEPRLRYSDLFVRDADGKQIRAWMTVTGGHPAIHIDDTEAVYPLEVDPMIWVERTKLLAGDAQAGDQLGFSVAIGGAIALIGAPTDDDNGADSGSVYVFLDISGNGSWMPEAKLKPSDGAAGDQFGISVSLDQGTALIGAYLDDDNGSETGSAYIFVRDANGGWSQQAKLLAADGGGGDRFGRGVSIYQNTALVGAYWDDVGGSQSGSAYVFTRSGGIWAQQQKLFASDGQAFDDFGLSVSLFGDSALVASHVDDDNGQSSGSVYFFTRSGGVWTQQQKIKPIDGAAGDAFGFPIKLVVNRAIFGAIGADDTATDAGAAYVFRLTNGVWTQEAKLLASDGQAGAQFGSSVGLSYPSAAVGAHLDDNANGANAGSVYVFAQSAGAWTEQAKLLASDGAAGDALGYSMVFAGNTMIVGAYGDDDGGAASGAAYVFRLSLTQGSSCVADFHCASLFCVDGRCCDTACGGGATNDCMACSAVLGAAADGTCAVLGLGSMCRGAVSACDVTETCDGVSTACPPDTLMPAGTVCHASQGACDAAETCDGTGLNCPADQLAPSGTVCRASAGACDVAETCNGMTNACPANTLTPMGTECRPSAGACDIAESCTGVTPTCPYDKLVSATVACRPSAGACDIADYCTGSSPACPTDARQMPGTQCRAAVGPCDAAESCNAMEAGCPADLPAAAGTSCRASIGACDIGEVCNGMDTKCPDNTYLPAGTPCPEGLCAFGTCYAAGTGSSSSGGVPPPSIPSTCSFKIPDAQSSAGFGAASFGLFALALSAALRRRGQSMIAR